MAEGAFFATAGKILEVLASEIFQEIGLAYGVQDEIDELNETVQNIQAVLLDAEERHRKPDIAVMGWLRRLKVAFYHAEDLLDDFSTELLRRKTMSGSKVTKEVRIFFSKYNQPAYALKVSRKIKAIRKRLETLRRSRDFHLNERRHEREETISRETHSLVHEKEIIGRENDKNEIINRLLMDSDKYEAVSVIPIVGMGGLGKTTVAQLVYNDEKVKNYFDLRMWVYVSDVFSLKTIVEKIIRSATGRPSENLDLDQLQGRLREEINGKRYLLVLDDVWNENYDRWLQIETLLKNDVRGSKIVVTTRSRQVAEVSSKLPFHDLKQLSEDESWSLFKEMIWGKGVEPEGSELAQIGKDIVAKCVGVPIAIRMMAGLLNYHNTEADWLHFRDNRLSSIPSGRVDEILQTLGISYDYLPSHLKQCFAYCANFPKGYEIEKKQLILLWMAQGFLGLSTGKHFSNDVGNEYFMSLLSRYFLEVVEYDERGDVIKCKIHDLMHDLAQSVSKNYIDQFSFVSETRSFKFSLPYWKKLKSFLWLFDGKCEGKLNESYFKKRLSSFKRLRALNLSKSGIEIVPSSIGKLKHLRYLNLSYNGGIKKLPNSVSKLCNLQTFDLSFCNNLVELPRGIGKLVSLSHLIVDFCTSLVVIPEGLSLLTSLHTLPLFTVGESTKLSRLNGLNNLRGDLRIKNLGDMENPSSANLEGKEYLQSLTLEWDRNKTDVEVHETLLEGLKPHRNLKELCISGFGGVKVSSWLSSLIKLTMLTISNSARCQCIPQLDHLPSLKGLTLSDFPALQYIDSSAWAPSRATIFQALRQLKIISCPELKGWWRTNDNNIGGSTFQMAEAEPYVFPRLSDLTIQSCPKLISMPLYPSLEKLYLRSTSLKAFQQTMMLPTSSTAPPPLSQLKSLDIGSIDDIETLPEEWLPNFTSIVEIRISTCPKLVSLPQSLQRSATLRSIGIYDCPDMTNLPEGLQLQSLVISGCPQLSQRFGNDMAVDWPKIAHIPCIEIDDKLIQMGGF